MRCLAVALKAASVQILDHHYSYDTFGSWHLVLKHKGIVTQLAYDVRDSYLGLRRAPERKPPYHFGPEQRVGEGATFGNVDDEAIEEICCAIAS
jgi:hypothetical protein